MSKLEVKASNWREEIDQKLKRLHSLLFGAEIAMDSGDFTSAQILCLRLLGFLESHTQRNDIDEAFIGPIRRQVLSKLDVARSSLTAELDRQAFEAAGRAPGKVFGKVGDMDIEHIKQSKHFRVLVHQAKTNHKNEPGQAGPEDNPGWIKSKVSGRLCDTEMTSVDNNNVRCSKYFQNKSYMTSKGGDPGDCMIMEPPLVAFSNQEGRLQGNNSGVKQIHIETRSPKVECSRSPSSNEECNNEAAGHGFVTARTKLELDAKRKRLGGSAAASGSPICDNSSNRSYGARSYGVSRRGVRGNFVPPVKSNGNSSSSTTARIGGKSDDGLEDSTKRCLDLLCGPDGELPEKLRNLEPRLLEHVSNEIMDRDPNVRWNDIAGLDHAKKCVTEMVIWPLMRPDIFKGCRAPGRGLLLFGPPGTGKTMIGKAIAGEANATFFYISASSLTSKWIGEGEKLVRALFGVASCRQPAVIFVDEIDSLLSQRKSEGEHEASRRMKTQFLIEMEGFDSGSEQILLIGATNRPQELDEAARRRLTKRLYIPLPSSEARAWIIRNLLDKDGLFALSKEDIDVVCQLTEGYSGSDMKNLVKDASMGPLREALQQGVEIANLKKEDMRPVTLKDFKNALHEVRPSVSLNELGIYEQWNQQFGSLAL